MDIVKEVIRPGSEDKKLPNHRDRKEHTNRPRAGQERYAHQTTYEQFRGNHTDLQGFVYAYDVRGRASQFRETTEKIGEWSKQNCAPFPLDVWRALDALKEPDQNTWLPDAPGDPNDIVDAAIFK